MSTRLPVDDAVKLFAVSNQLLENELTRIEREHGIDLGRSTPSDDRDDTYYPQFSKEVREEAARMAQHYEIFYCLEKTIRAFVTDALEAAEGAKWWTTPRVPAHIQGEVTKRIEKEMDAGITPRSADALDYTTFGELGEVIKSNWDVFGAVLNSPKAVERIMSGLNTLRGPIAHCSDLAEDEVVRLRLSVRDWFRQMEKATP